MDEINDIIKKCTTGDNKAREELYRLFAPKLYPICLRYGRNTEDANDIMQEGFIKIFNKINQFSFAGSFEGWMKRIMVNTALEKYRNVHYMNTYEDTYSVKDDFKVEHTIADISAAELLEVIKELPPQYKLVFNLYAIEGYSHKEIAQKLNISEGTSKSNLSRARGILQDKVNKLYGLQLKKIVNE